MNLHSQRGFASHIVVIATLVICSVVGVGVYAYKHRSAASDAAQQDFANSKDVLMVVEFSGGLCEAPNSPTGKSCYSADKLYMDGTFENRTKLSKTEVSTLESHIQNTDFNSFPHNPYPRCPSALDGSDMSLVFPRKYGNKSFTLCMLQIPKDDTTISYIYQLLRDHEKK